MNEITPKSPEKAASALALLALVSLTVVAYWPIRTNAFIDIDDPIYVTANPYVIAGLHPANLVWAFTTVHAANWHPLTWVSHMLDCQLWGLNPFPHHATNVVLHAISACILFAIVRRIGGSILACAIVAAIFAVHPAHVESVAWVAERKDVLAAFFGLGSIYAYVRYAQNPRGSIWYWTCFVMLLLGLLSKPMLVTLPFVFLLLDYWPLSRWFSQPSGKGRKRAVPLLQRRIFYEKIPFVILAIGSCVMTFIAQRKGGAVASVEQWPIEQRLANVMVSYLRYLGVMFWPTNLGMFYPLSGTGWPAWLVFIATVVLATITVIAFVLRRRRPYLIVGWLWFVGMLVPTIGIVQVGGQSIADRYLYLPSIGLSIAVVWWVSELLRTKSAQRIAGVIAALVLVACAILTNRQVRFWNNTEALMRHTLSVVPDNAFCRFYLGVAAAQQARSDEAISQFTRAIQLQPNFLPPYVGLGRILMVVGRFNDARQYLAQAEVMNPGDAWVHWNYGDLSALQGDWKSAAAAYQRSLEVQPDEPIVIQNLSLSLIQLGEFQQAEAVLKKFLQLCPDDLSHHYQLAVVLFRNGETDAAARELSLVADHSDPVMAPQIQWQLSLLYLRSGKIEPALPHLREAARLNPNLAPALQNLAWILATHPDPAKRDAPQAIELAQRANDLSGHQMPEILDTLAAAYAANREFAQAAETAQKATTLASDPALRQQIEQRLALYRDRKPFVDHSLLPR